MGKEYIRPEFRIISLESKTDIANDLSEPQNNVPEDKEDGFGPWVPL